jgi:hypothetical protein
MPNQLTIAAGREHAARSFQDMGVLDVLGQWDE